MLSPFELHGYTVWSIRSIIFPVAPSLSKIKNNIHDTDTKFEATVISEEIENHKNARTQILDVSVQQKGQMRLSSQGVQDAAAAQSIEVSR